MYITSARLILLGITVFLGVVFSINSTNKGKSENLICVNCDHVKLQQLRKGAQDALNAISSRNVSCSGKRAKRGQHVFNNGVLGFHRSVLQDLLREVGGYEHLENLMRDLVNPLDQTVQNAISTMVAHFRAEEFYVDYNADVFGEYVKQLRAKLVAYLRADTAVTIDGREGIQQIRRQVHHITTQMVNHEVYVDPMARDRWLLENPRGVEQYNQAIDAIAIMFRNILQDFQKVSDKMKVFRLRGNKWIWDEDL